VDEASHQKTLDILGLYAPMLEVVTVDEIRAQLTPERQ
jgi:hypothetical protein